MLRRKHVCLVVSAIFVLGVKFSPLSSLIPIESAMPNARNVATLANPGPGDETHFERTRFHANSSHGKFSSPPLPNSFSERVRITNETSTTTKEEEEEEEREWARKREFMETEFERRRNYLRTMCQQHYIEPASTINMGDVDQSRCQTVRSGYSYRECIFSGNFPLARSASSMSCLINKVASTSIVSSMLNADGTFKPPSDIGESPHMYASSIVAKKELEFEFARKYFFKFVVVRHPFRRLLSAFRDKVENAPHWTLQQAIYVCRRY